MCCSLAFEITQDIDRYIDSWLLFFCERGTMSVALSVEFLTPLLDDISSTSGFPESQCVDTKSLRHSPKDSFVPEYPSSFLQP